VLHGNPRNLTCLFLMGRIDPVEKLSNQHYDEAIIR
jgi:hypothetical protein